MSGNMWRRIQLRIGYDEFADERYSVDILQREVITTLSNVVMAGIWLVYLHLFLSDYRQKIRPLFVIHHAQGNDPGSLCLFVNMSQEPIHVQCVMADVEYQDTKERLYVTDYHRMTAEEANVQAKLRQGPIQSGGYLILGSFEDIILNVTSKPEQDGSGPVKQLAEAKRLRICVATLHGRSKHPVGASRDFCIEQVQGRTYIRPVSSETRQLVASKHKKEVRGWIEESLEYNRH